MAASGFTRCLNFTGIELLDIYNTKQTDKHIAACESSCTKLAEISIALMHCVPLHLQC